MATILRGYGWESGNRMINSIDWTSGAPAINASGYTGTYCLQLYGLGDWYLRWALSGSPSNPSASVWILPTHATNNDAWGRDQSIKLQFLLGTGELIELRYRSATSTLDAYVDGSNVASGSITLSDNGWFHVQFYAVIDNSGSIGCKINGHTSITYSGDTQPGAATGATYFRVAGINQRGFRIDDLVYGYGGYLGDLRCVDIRPSADTAQDDWTPSTGSDNYAMIDEVPASDADYNETITNGHADELALGDFDGTNHAPVAVTAWVRARQDAGVGDSIKVGVDSGGTDDVSAAQALSNSWEYYFHTLDDNPADSAEWEDADIDALLLRYEAVIP